jgi:KDO2-lipid IV(A) lauroyltransferase
MRLPAQLHKARNQRFRKRAADFEDRKPFERFPLWLRILSSLPLPAWYALASFLAFVLDKVMKSRREIVDMQLAACFPDRDKDWIAATRSAFYRNFADVSVEIIKAVTMKPGEIASRVTLENPEAARAAMDAGRSIIIVTSHNCNWEWALLKLSLEMGHPVHAAYKPLKGRWGDRLMMTIRSRFGAEMIPARRLLMRVMRHRGPARVIAMVADQAPTSSGVRYFTQFMGLDTALPHPFRRDRRGRGRAPDRRADRTLRGGNRSGHARASARLALELPALEGAARCRGQPPHRQVRIHTPSGLT